MENNIEYKEYKNSNSSIKWKLWIVVFVVWVSFSILYFYLYQQNYYNYYLPTQQEYNRFIIDSTNTVNEINRLKIKDSECVKILEQDQIESKALSTIINNIFDGQNPKKGEKFFIRGDSTYPVTILKLDDKCNIDDTIFKIQNKKNDKIYFCKLRLPKTSWAKMSKEKASSNYSIREKLDKNEDIVRDELEELKEKHKDLKREIAQLNNRKNSLSPSNVLNFFDFLIFSANIHTTLGFNGITPTSTLLRFICVVHKLITLYLYYLLYTKYKDKD